MSAGFKLIFRSYSDVLTLLSEGGFISKLPDRKLWGKEVCFKSLLSHAESDTSLFVRCIRAVMITRLNLITQFTKCKCELSANQQ